jgi:PPM family protein phosphatase
MKLNAFALTDIGLKRKINQDAFLRDDALGLYIVADGMGGHRGGEVASKLAVDVVQQYCAENKGASGRDLLDKGINASCAEIYKHALAHEELAGMGTTIAALLFTKEGNDEIVYIGQVGDSRAYLLCADGIWQVTEDHSLLNEEIRAGRLAAGQVASYQFRNVITRSVGYENHVAVDIYRRKLKPGDTYFLCTDGLSGLVSITEINDELRKNGLENGVKNLVGLANLRGGDDNITALACQVLE